MPPDLDLSRLSDAQKDALIVFLFARIEALELRIKELTRPPRTPDNSGVPPSRGQKPNHPEPRPTHLDRRGRPGVGRTLHENPDRVVEARLSACPHCAALFPGEAQTPQLVYKRIETPPMQPDVTRVRLFGGACGCCGKRATAVAPVGLEPGSLFGKSVEALAVSLHYAHAVGLERLQRLMAEVFGLAVSEGALCNMLARARTPLAAAARPIADAVAASRVLCCDETGCRVGSRTWWG